MFALYKPTNSGHKGEIILTVTGHSLYQPLLISSTLPWRRWISQIGCSTFLTLNINSARTYTSQQAIPLAMMDIPCQSMLVQHFVAQVQEPHFCCLVSIS